MQKSYWSRALILAAVLCFWTDHLLATDFGPLPSGILTYASIDVPLSTAEFSARDFSEFDGTYRFVVTGGTGDGLLVFDAVAASSGLYYLPGTDDAGGGSNINSPFGLGTIGLPQFDGGMDGVCSGFSTLLVCAVPFTYNVRQEVRFQAISFVDYSVFSPSGAPVQPLFGGLTFSTSTYINAVQIFDAADNYSQPNLVAVISAVPEPATGFAAAGLAAIVIALRRNGRQPS